LGKQNRTGPAPFGFVRQGQTLLGCKKEAEIRTMMFELYVEAKRKSFVAEELNARGLRTRSGTVFSSQTVGRYLSDPIVLGHDPNVEQIVNDDLFHRVQDILNAQARTGGAKRSPRHLLAGLLFCGCGDKMYVPSSSRKYVCGTCRNKSTKADLDALVVDQLRKLPATNVETLKSLLTRWDSLPFPAQRETVETLIERVDLDGKSLTLSFRDI